LAQVEVEAQPDAGLAGLVGRAAGAFETHTAGLSLSPHLSRSAPPWTLEPAT